MRALVARMAVIIPMKVGDSITATSPGSSVARATSARDERDRLLGTGGDDDLVCVLGVAVGAAASRDLLTQIKQSLGGEVGQCSAADLREHLGGDARQLVGGVGAGCGPARGQRDDVVAPGQRERVCQHLLGVREIVLRQRVHLPVVTVLGAAGRRERPYERSAPDLGGHVAELGELAVDASGGEMVDACLGGQLAGWRELRARSELARLDGGGEAVDELLRDRDAALPVEIRQVELV